MRTAIASVSRQCPGPSATTTEEAPSRLSALAAATTIRGSVLIEAPLTNSTRFGLSRTLLRAHVRLDEPEPVEHDRFEIAVVAPRTEHGDR